MNKTELHPTPPDRTADQLTHDRVRGDRLALLYGQSLQAAAVSVVIAGLLGATYWADADHGRVGTWLGLVVLSAGLRTMLFITYSVQRPSNAAILAWQRPYVATLMVSALVWGVGSVWAMPRGSLLHEAVAFSFLMGMAGGALSVYSAIRLLALAAISALLLPLTLWMAVEGGLVRSCMSLGSAVFFLSALRATRVLSTTLQRNFELTYALHDAKEAAERLASTDALTGLANRRAFFEQAAVPLNYCRRSDRPVAAMLLDLDHFKRINDAHGHAVGDLALRHVAQTLRAILRKSDICCRLGGEEFAVLLPDTSLEDAYGVAEKLRAAIERGTVPVPGNARGLSITVSIGVAESASDLESLLDRADAAMYDAKHAGRNRVAVLGTA